MLVKDKMDIKKAEMEVSIAAEMRKKCRDIVVMQINEKA